jgi:putative transposase
MIKSTVFIERKEDLIMDQKSMQVRRSQWEQIVLECNKAPISKKEWCLQNGINIKSFYYWQRKIRKSAVTALDETASTVSIQVTAPSSSFVEVPIPSPTQNDSEGTPFHSLTPELMIHVDGCQIYVTGSVQEHTLNTVLKVIRNA